MSTATPGPEQAAAEGGVYKLANILHPVNSTQNIAKATVSRFSAFGQKFSHEGKYAQSAPFSWAA